MLNLLSTGTTFNDNQSDIKPKLQKSTLPEEERKKPVKTQHMPTNNVQETEHAGNRTGDNVTNVNGTHSETKQMLKNFIQYNDTSITFLQEVLTRIFS
jgi:hypothetical protein